ncbi:MAG: hypothetical protein C7B44_06015 [Sulfobacillus thermosulfidooxidans]|uniref:Uncharacterized protein n=1 Tax=Sulfobacillus thermotolerans TaxID=338644 RepID=A0ABM6RSZ5_9FIRM|nr:hypothetical protein [Sulfobacillus sp. hq2]AUW94558.1 hypothetical protein BXT84_11895 [Sulfobacillus thermotolerans]MCY0908092.1 hypothetical protein [Sulfobacillus thermotolerans]POB09149.1 hypothetical protein CO251_16420 [Sulfobacillus sp. hq2]PSR36995.1 MAG: hypothetical protein C7B44_06015 [Sulfobacillus thermosulfidooxidans]
MSSSGSSLSKERRHSVLDSDSKPARRRHVFRWFVVIVAVLGSVLLWQLNFFIHTLGDAQRSLESWQGVRAILGSFLTFAAMQISHTALTLWHHVFH